MEKTDLIIIGGGILGTFHAYHALKAGKSVRLFEKNGQPQGATVRNFGQIVPSGMDDKWQQYGRKSLEIYEALQAELDLTIRRNGSIYLASDAEEWQLLTELNAINKTNQYPSFLISKEGCLQKYSALKPTYVKGGLYFPKEISLDPRQMIYRMHQYLKEKFEYDYYFNTPVLQVVSTGRDCQVITNESNLFSAEKVIICNGSEFKLLFPKLFATSDLEVSKLQMLATIPQPTLKMFGNILTGLSIRRYESFRACPSYQAIKEKERPDSFWKKWGIHILFKQADDGSIIIGDSHEYATAYESDKLGFDNKQMINDYILNAAKEIFDLETWQIQRKWAGFYSQCQTKDIFQHHIDNCIHIITGIGGKGMTASPGFAETNIKKIFNL